MSRSALTEIGETERARALYEKLLAYASPLLLYSSPVAVCAGPQPATG